MMFWLDFTSYSLFYSLLVQTVYLICLNRVYVTHLNYRSIDRPLHIHYLINIILRSIDYNFKMWFLYIEEKLMLWILCFLLPYTRRWFIIGLFTYFKYYNYNELYIYITEWSQKPINACLKKHIYNILTTLNV